MLEEIGELREVPDVEGWIERFPMKIMEMVTEID